MIHAVVLLVIQPQYSLPVDEADLFVILLHKLHAHVFDARDMYVSTLFLPVMTSHLPLSLSPSCAPFISIPTRCGCRESRVL